VVVLDTIFVQKIIKITYILAKNSTKIAATFLTQICTKSFVGSGSAPDSTGEAYSAPPDP